MKKLLFTTLAVMPLLLLAQAEMPLYDLIPNSIQAGNTEKSEVNQYGLLIISNVSVPSITIYKPLVSQNPNGTCVIICPGGGYGILAASHEGSDVARTFNSWGVTAVVLKYRLPNDKIMPDKSIAPLQDAERAIQLVRLNAKEWGINPKKIGIMGFSAGGHLAASLSTRYNEKLIANPKKISLRPNFSILIYPVISFTDSLTHMGSRNNLIGLNPSQEKIRQYSNELNVNKKTPPAFLVHAKDDDAVTYRNSVVYAEALRKNKVQSSIKFFDKGGHGFGMNNKTSDEKWMNDLRAWMIDMKLLNH